MTVASRVVQRGRARRDRPGITAMPGPHSVTPPTTTH